MDVNQVQETSSTEPTTDQQRDRSFRHRLLIVLGVSLFCHTIAIAAPGWHSEGVSGGSYAKSTGLFYYKICSYEDCETMSYIQLYADAMKKAELEQRIILRRNFCIGALREMLGSIVAWILCLVTFVFLTYSITKKKDLRHSLFHLSSMLSVAGVIMGEISYVHLVITDANIKGLGATRLIDSHLGFPYAILFYILACILVFIAVILMAIYFKREIVKPIIKRRVVHTVQHRSMGETNQCYVLQDR